MEMVGKMKPIANSAIGSRIASVHNGSSLFTGDAGSGESNIRRYIIERDMLDTIIQLPNNLFYNTGITTYIWLVTNTKPEARRGRVQLIDANLMYRKLRKNLGDKNCEFAPEHIENIISAYLAFQPVERELDANDDPTGIAVRIFDNTDFGYHKVTVERPDRRRAQFGAERLEPLRFDKSLREPMEHLWAAHGDKVYEPGFLKSQAKAIQAWCEEQEIAFNAKQRAKLVDTGLWLRQRELIEVGHQLMYAVGTEETADFNVFRDHVGKVLRARKIKLTAAEKNAILNAVSWYADDAEKVVDSVRRFTKSEIEDIATRFGCHIDELGDFGLYVQSDGSWLTYESSADLRDSEAVPLADSIHRYFKAEVRPHVPEAWINLDTVKIGYEISFNKYFYRHKPLRSLEAVTRDILALEQKADGLIADILGVKPADLPEAV
jgi:type I restriction enzyme M protein